MPQTDTCLDAQNAAVACEAADLGVCYIGGMRDHPEQVADLAGLPQEAVPHHERSFSGRDRLRDALAVLGFALR